MSRKTTVRKPRAKVNQRGMVVDTYSVLRDCVEHGVALGYSRAHKHLDNPEADTLKTAIEEAVMGQICEYFFFQDIER